MRTFERLAFFGVPAAIDASAQFLAGAEEWDRFRIDHDLLASAGIATDTGLAFANREGAKPTQFDPVTIGQSVSDFVQNDSYNPFEIFLTKMRIF